MKKLITSLLALSTASGLWASSMIGDFLAMDMAFKNYDDQVASRYLDRTIEALPNNAVLYDQALIMSIYERDLEKARDLVAQARKLDQGSQIPDLVDLTIALNNEDFDQVENLSSIFDFLDPVIVKSWAQAENGDPEGALSALEAEAKKVPELAALYDYERAMLMARYNEDYATAVKTLLPDGKPLLLTSTSYLDLWAIRILSKEENVEATLEKEFGARAYWPHELSVLVDASLKGEVLPSLGFASAQNGIAEYITFTVQQSDVTKLPAGIERLVYLMMPVIAPNKDAYKIQLMAYFLDREEYDDVIRTSELIDDRSAYAYRRDIYKFYALTSMDKLDEARAVLKGEPKTIEELSFWGDASRQLEDYQAAYDAYKKILDYPEVDASRLANVEFLAGVSAQELDMQEESFAHLRKAIELDPENSNYLNHLGYTLVDTGIGIEEGFEMIKRAVKISSEESNILDSLGWAYFKVGNYEEAVGPIELASSGMPYHPVINAHLGDAYWKVGRKREAVYQWKRALANLEEDLPDITRAQLEDRLENGLD